MIQVLHVGQMAFTDGIKTSQFQELVEAQRSGSLEKRAQLVPIRLAQDDSVGMSGSSEINL